MLVLFTRFFDQLYLLYLSVELKSRKEPRNKNGRTNEYKDAGDF